jgi:hypothetical protein
MDLFKSNYDKFTVNFTGKSNLKLSNSDDWYSSHITPLMHLTNIYYLFFKGYSSNNTRWFSFQNIDQKFQKMFFSSSTQQRVLAN